MLRQAGFFVRIHNSLAFPLRTIHVLLSTLHQQLVMRKQIRKPEVVVVSDFHLATHACKAVELHKYLKSILPKKLVLNGDIIDAWRFSRNYFPKSHLKVLRQIIKMMEKGTEVIYITGNHDEFLRKFENTTLGKLKVLNQLTLNLDGKKTWIFHGDIFDSVIHKAKWLAKTGAAAYGLITMINKGLNVILRFLHTDNVILYKKIKDLFGRSKPEMSWFEREIAHLACDKDIDTVICGHTHIPLDKTLVHEDKQIRYINCGDWVENFSAAEYEKGAWNLLDFSPENSTEELEADELVIPDKKELYEAVFNQLVFTN